MRRIVLPKYARAETSEETSEGQIVQAPAKDLPFGRSKAGVSLDSHMSLISKYVEHLPLHYCRGQEITYQFGGPILRSISLFIG